MIIEIFFDKTAISKNVTSRAFSDIINYKAFQFRLKTLPVLRRKVRQTTNQPRE